MQNNSKKIALIACAVAVLSSFLPWATVQTVFGQIEIPGSTGDGQLTIVLAVLAGMFCYFGKRAMLVLAIIASSLGIATTAFDIVDISSKGGNGVATITVGYGVYLCLIAFVVGLIEIVRVRKTLVVVQHNDISWAPPRRLSDVK